MMPKVFLTSMLIFLLCVPLASAENYASPRVSESNSAAEINVYQDVSTMTMSDVLTFDELASVYSSDEGIPLEEARQVLLSKYNSGSTARKSTISPLLATYRTFEVPLDSMRYYKPSLRFYCETSEGGYFHGIVQVLNTAMNRVYQGIAKQFGGTVFTNLENASTIHYMVSGDFYDNGTTTTGGSGTAKIGEYFEISYNVSHSSNWYATIYEESDFVWY